MQNSSKKSFPFIILVLVLTLAACAPIAQQPTSESGGEIAVASTAVPEGNETQFTFEGVSLSFDPVLSTGASGQVIPEKSGGDTAYWDIYPRTIAIDLLGYPVSGSAYAPKIVVYPVEDFRRLSEPAGIAIDQLQKLLSEKPAMVESIPVLPLQNSLQVFRSNTKYLPFQNGNGIRFIGMNSQGIVPVNNGDLFYTYQGLTSDGNNYISVTLPVNYPTLPAKWDSLSEDERLKLVQDPQYMPNLAANLSVQPESSFLPDLANLDALIQSITIAQ